MSVSTLIWVVFGLAALPAVLLLVNLMLYRRAPGIGSSLGASEADPLVSVCIPARDEEANIEGCVRAALAAGQSPGKTSQLRFEVVVLDDHSGDRTPELVQQMAQQDPRVRLELAPTLPGGWNGKQHACWQLAQRARSPWLLFVDADVQLQRGSLPRLVASAERRGTDLLSGFPHQRTGTFLERLLIPLIHFVLLGFLPLPGVRWSRWSAFGAGCGQLMLVRREAYFEADGHRAIRASRHDGVQLPRAFRRAGRRTDLVDATDLASCRMYRSAGEVWTGLTKNAHEGMATRGAIGPWTVLLFGGQVLPWLLLALAGLGTLGSEVPLGVLLGACLLGVTTRAVLALRFRQSLLGVLTHPISVVLLLAVQVHALVLAERGRTVAWKGREAT